jgi:hypothetical protein
MTEAKLPPLIVDLDGTLALGDSTWRSAGLAFTRNPIGAAAALAAFAHGRAAGKRAFAAIAIARPASLPYRKPLIAFLEKERQRGRSLHLASGADQRIVDSVAAHLGLFETAHGSDGRINLKGAVKLAWLEARFPAGFDYAGDARADLPIWRAIGRAMLVGEAIKFAPRLREQGVHILATI